MVSFEKIENVTREIGEQTKAQAVVLFGSYARNQAGRWIGKAKSDLLNADNNLDDEYLKLRSFNLHNSTYVLTG